MNAELIQLCTPIFPRAATPMFTLAAACFFNLQSNIFAEMLQGAAWPFFSLSSFHLHSINSTDAASLSYKKIKCAGDDVLSECHRVAQLELGEVVSKKSTRNIMKKISHLGRPWFIHTWTSEMGLVVVLCFYAAWKPENGRN